MNTFKHGSGWCCAWCNREDDEREAEMASQALDAAQPVQPAAGIQLQVHARKEEGGTVWLDFEVTNGEKSSINLDVLLAKHGSKLFVNASLAAQPVQPASEIKALREENAGLQAVVTEVCAQINRVIGTESAKVLVAMIEEGVTALDSHAEYAFLPNGRDLTLLRNEIKALRKALVSIREHVKSQPSALAKAIVATVDAAMKPAPKETE